MKAFAKHYEISPQGEKLRDFLSCYTGKPLSNLVNISLIASMYEPLTLWNRIIPFKIELSQRKNDCELKKTSLKYKVTTWDICHQISCLFQIEDYNIPELMLGVALDLFLDGKLNYYSQIYDKNVDDEEKYGWNYNELGSCVTSKTDVYPFTYRYADVFKAHTEPMFLENIVPILLKTTSKPACGRYGTQNFVSMPVCVSDLLSLDFNLIAEQEKFRMANIKVPQEYYDNAEHLKYNSNKSKIMTEKEDKIDEDEINKNKIDEVKTEKVESQTGDIYAQKIKDETEEQNDTEALKSQNHQINNKNLNNSNNFNKNKNKNKNKKNRR